MTRYVGFLAKGRFWLAGPVAFFLAIIFMAGSSVWLPAGAAAVNNLVLPVIAFPLIWAALFFYACLARRLRWVCLIFVIVLATSILAIWWHWLSLGVS